MYPWPIAVIRVSPGNHTSLCVARFQSRLGKIPERSPVESIPVRCPIPNAPRIGTMRSIPMVWARS